MGGVLRLPYGLLKVPPFVWIRIVTVLHTLHVLVLVHDGVADTFYRMSLAHQSSISILPSNYIPEINMPMTNSNVVMAAG